MRVLPGGTLPGPPPGRTSMFGRSKKKPPPGPDFSHVDSLEKAAAMFRKGKLEKLYLIPLEFGGPDSENNVVYVPLGLNEVKRGIDVNVIGPLVKKEKVTQYRAEPEYQGESFVPIAINITAWDPGEFTTTINIWGEALERE
jgi:hypothetical protein